MPATGFNCHMSPKSSTCMPPNGRILPFVSNRGASHDFAGGHSELAKELRTDHTDLVGKDPSQKLRLGGKLVWVSCNGAPAALDLGHTTPVMYGLTLDLSSHRALKCQAHELHASTPPQHFFEGFSNPINQPAFAASRLSMYHIE